MHTHVLTFDGDVVLKKFVSWDRGEADREWSGLVALSEGSPGLAPMPLERTVKDGAPVIVMSMVPGTPLGDAPLTARQHGALGSALRRLFATPLPDHLPKRRCTPQEMWQRVDEEVRARHELSALDDAPLVVHTLGRCREWLSENHFEVEEPRPVFGHADGNLANVMWDGSVCRLVDFEDSGSSTISYEFADLIEHISGRRDNLVDVSLLAHEAGINGEQRSHLQSYRVLMAMFWLVMLLPGNPGYDRNPPGTTAGQAKYLLNLLAA